MLHALKFGHFAEVNSESKFPVWAYLRAKDNYRIQNIAGNVIHFLIVAHLLARNGKIDWKKVNFQQ